RLVHFSIQSTHLHLIAEAEDRRELARGVKGLLVRSARALNRLWRRRGQVFADRYHEHVLRTPREVRAALAYVLLNARKHGLRIAGIDPGTSGCWFDGWVEPRQGPESIVTTTDSPCEASVARARTWLLRIGWRRHGLVDPGEDPGRRRERSRPSG